MKQGALTFLGIDVGTSSVKVLAFNREHRESVGVSYPPETSLYEHDADMVAQTVRLALRKLFAKGNVSPHQVAGIDYQDMVQAFCS